MSRPTTIALLLLIAGCAPRIPAVKLDTAPHARAGPTVSPCLLVGESVERRLYEGTATASLEEWHSGIGSILIRHPKGMVIIDPAFGRTIEDDLKRSPPWFTAIMGTAHGKIPLLTLLERAGVDSREVAYALLSHAHWDHAGALRDLPKAKVLLDEKEFAYARGRRGHLDHGVMRHHFDIPAMRFQPFVLDGPPYEGFTASKDLFGDGTIVAVPLHGHTPGHTGYFINGPDGARWLYIGDAAWALEGIKQPVHKNLLASGIVDHDLEAVAQTLAVLHAFTEQRPDVKVVPAHDFDAMRTLPECGAK